MKKMVQYLKLPYPFERKKWSTIVLISLFVSFFLIVFKPFGSNGIVSPWRNYIMGGYGLVTFVVLVINLILIPSLFKKYFSNSYWTLGINVLWLCWILFTIGLGNYFYTICFFSIKGTWFQGLINAQIGTLLVGFFPVTIFTVLTYHRLMQKNVSAAQTINGQLHQANYKQNTGSNLSFTSENDKKGIELNDFELIYITSEGNYCTLYYELGQQIKKQMIRSTLSRIENQLNGHPYFFKCHRAFIVNLKHIEKTVGNSQGLKLIVKGGTEIPVARNYIKTLKQETSLLSNLK
ncbi:MAG TPA: hypothetical protein DCQ26_00755 [Marinilabiliales bacterium]|nr:MAG: hypothetical protein A2W95_17400 [Bacteroidetes bacterium GWA2_40_14]OFZ26435.1 MAG: hypothetical protein A2437_08035 [Bacteroidetes bacterium RIFOXYC2_FULL_40_12]HAM97118.1 hypothetical protein [Marinilabiliales bacterium]HAZ01173.1 hypothetical protein [Marinilabiliales bacterium]HBX84337.1 hypothetical protein [Marinilabiliales bacterium]